MVTSDTLNEQKNSKPGLGFLVGFFSGLKLVSKMKLFWIELNSGKSTPPPCNIYHTNRISKNHNSKCRILHPPPFFFFFSFYSLQTFTHKQNRLANLSYLLGNREKKRVATSYGQA